jgi:hypothetical protein
MTRYRSRHAGRESGRHAGAMRLRSRLLELLRGIVLTIELILLDMPVLLCWSPRPNIIR